MSVYALFGSFALIGCLLFIAEDNTARYPLVMTLVTTLAVAASLGLLLLFMFTR